MLAGSTDVGLWVTKQHKDLPTIIYTGDVDELKAIRDTEAGLQIGAAANLTDAYEALVGQYPELSELYRRFASPPIRNAGTLGGNIANGSPIGDSMPALIVMGVRSCCARAGTRARCPRRILSAYQKTSLAPGEFVERIRVPHRVPGTHLRMFKISKRFDQDISAVCGAFWVRLDHGRIADARIAYGGVAATPKRAPAAERALNGREWNESAVRVAMTALADDYAPLTDMRASSAYRKSVARNLLYKFWLETSGSKTATQVVDFIA